MTIHKYKECDECKKKEILEPIQIGGMSKWITLHSTGFGEDPFIFKKDFCSEQCLIDAINRWSCRQ